MLQGKSQHTVGSSSDLLLPSQYARRISLLYNATEFVPMTRESYAASSFLDERLIPAGPSQWLSNVEVSDALATGSANTSPPLYILHSAFCCSTLLCRVLDLIPGVMVLKEPYLPVQIANELLRGPKDRFDKREAWSPVEFEWVRELSGLLLRRVWPRFPHSITKLSDRSNIMIPRLLEEQGSKVLFVHGSLASFLKSVLARRELRQWVRNERFMLLSSSGRIHPLLRCVDGSLLTDAEVAACVWVDRALTCADLSGEFGAGVFAPIDGLRMKVEPLSVVQEVAAFLGLSELIEQDFGLAVGQATKFDSKQPNLRFEVTDPPPTDRMHDRLAREIDVGIAWASIRLEGVQTPMQIH